LPLKGKIASISTVAKGAYLIYVGKLAKAGKIGLGFDHAPTPRLHSPG
jgi:hypothetical protein